MDFVDSDAAQLAMVTAFVSTAMLCVALSVRYAAQHLVDELKEDIREGVSAIKRDLNKELDDVKARSNIDPPEDVSDGRSV